MINNGILFRFSHCSHRELPTRKHKSNQCRVTFLHPFSLNTIQLKALIHIWGAHYNCIVEEQILCNEVIIQRVAQPEKFSGWIF